MSTYQGRYLRIGSTVPVEIHYYGGYRLHSLRGPFIDLSQYVSFA